MIHRYNQKPLTPYRLNKWAKTLFDNNAVKWQIRIKRLRKYDLPYGIRKLYKKLKL